MKTKTLSSALRSTSPFLTTSRFVQKLSNAAAIRARFPLPPLGAVGDPYLLDRLHAPLRRYLD
jgi:hypothetical protein